ncbi:hyaluronan and proteoglycan link protein 3 [Antennarius striatus]|uniref:hyaluronan and proteoglycan link protein 3 n=1 Tax=Antennarius striatus TaxID=241820 RepID=UPI0035B44D4E
MTDLLRPLLAVGLYLLLLPGGHGQQYHNGFRYRILRPGLLTRATSSLEFIQIHVEAPQTSVWAMSGSNVTIPCSYYYDSAPALERKPKVKWSWVPSRSSKAELFTLDAARERNVLVAIGDRQRVFGDFEGRVRLRRSTPGDVSLILTDMHYNDTGRYRCEVIDGLEDQSVTVELELQGVVFPYMSKEGRYSLNFYGAKVACEDQGSSLATFEQLYAEWEQGLDWCNAGWLADGTVRYPIRQPRENCGGDNLADGLRSYGQRDRLLDTYDAFCFTGDITGSVYLYQYSLKLNYTEAVQACVSDGSQIAKVGQLYVMWKLKNFHICQAGWLHDQSIRCPVSEATINCSGLKSGVHSFGFPPLNKKFGVYCYR